MNSLAYYQSLLIKLCDLKNQLPTLCCSKDEQIFVQNSIDRLINQIYIQIQNVETYENQHRES